MRFVLALLLLSVSAPAAAAASSGRLHTQLLRDGFVRVPHLLSRDEARAWGSVVAAAAAREAEMCERCSLSDTSDITSRACFGCSPTGVGASTSFTRSWRLADEDTSLASFIKSPTLAAVAARALNASVVRLYQATAFVKHPGDAPSACVGLRGGWDGATTASPSITLHLLTPQVAPRCCGIALTHG